MFFERRTQSSIKHRRLQYLLLLALRAALLILLALAFANPFIRTSQPQAIQGRKMMVLAIDDSFSMRQGDRLERAKQEAVHRARRTARGRSRPGAGVRLPDPHDERRHERRRDAARRRSRPSSRPTSAAPSPNWRALCAPSRNRRRCRWKRTCFRTCRSRTCRRISPTCGWPRASC